MKHRNLPSHKTQKQLMAAFVFCLGFFTASTIVDMGVTW
jgi:hypothetical protein